MRKWTMAELKRLTPEAFKEEAKTPIIVVLDNVRSALNVGSVFRTSDAFLIEKIYLCGITAQPPHKEIFKTALGATDTVEWEYSETTEAIVATLKEKGYQILAVEQATESVGLQDFVPVATASYAVVLGNEVEGVSNAALQMADYCLEIPQFGSKHSLNVSVCAGVVLWELFRKMRLTTLSKEQA